jgi:predicted nucleic acid-binding protein
LSRVEIVSAIHRRWRKEPTAQRQVDAALRELARTSIDWFEVIDVRSARVRAEHILKIHALRAADALQLGAALIAADGEPARLPFVTLDRRLASAAEREGFPVTALS